MTETFAKAASLHPSICRFTVLYRTGVSVCNEGSTVARSPLYTVRLMKRLPPEHLTHLARKSADSGLQLSGFAPGVCGVGHLTHLVTSVQPPQSVDLIHGP